MKKVFILILMFVMLVQMNSINIKAANKAEYDISPRYVVTCSAGGKHKMYVQGLAKFYSGTSLSNLGDFLFYGTASRCSKCEMMCFSEIYPTATVKKLGRYTLSTSTYQDAIGYYVYGPYKECNNLVDDPIIHGFEWY